MGLFDNIKKKTEQKIEQYNKEKEEHLAAEAERARMMEEHNKRMEERKEYEKERAIKARELEKEALEKEINEYINKRVEIKMLEHGDEVIEDAKNNMLKDVRMLQKNLKENHLIHWHPNGTAYYFSKNDEDFEWYNQEFPIELDENNNYIAESIPVPDNVEVIPKIEMIRIINTKTQSYAYFLKKTLDDYIYEINKKDFSTYRMDYYQENNYINSVDYMNKQFNKDKDASVIGRGVVGGVLAGPTGAVIGTVSALDKNIKNNK